MISVVLLGAGNVATHLFKAFNKAENVDVVQWYNRTKASISSYVNKVEITDELNELRTADIYIIAISDDSIGKLSENLPFKNRLVAHTSGSVNIHDLDKKNERAVFYPLQTFSKDAKVDFSQVPICYQALEKSNNKLLKTLAKAIGSPSYKINTEQRQTLHLSAVFINNFVNQLYRIAHEITDNKNIEFDILKPLISETAKKVQNISPYMAQTGPAKRNDKKTINRHLNQLENRDHQKIYKLLTESIQQTHGLKNKNE
ncbi:Rossmann-like and DUF2520 domain-containing protein [Winogradskyella ursingii]|uniref:Rossmann-like and DUF2520 domain-containing protein n=1 Tax=Winogradskyella ursingii TaxID=2686079 RepID=UPI0015CDCCCA|nr:DUF2520 domain-containing protein [Winogradskyella ursingii]